MLTKTQFEIMKVLASRIGEKFSIKQISEIMNKPYPLVHRSARLLVESALINKDERKLLSINYKENMSGLSYIESCRKEEFLKKNKTAALFVKDALSKMGTDFFTMVIFGSVLEKKEPRDVDVLVIIEDKDKINETEKILYAVASNFSIKFDISVISTKSIYEMLAKRDEANVMNETLNNHIIVFGAENYYRLLKNAR